MRYSEIDLQCEDIMWFGVDSFDHIFVCTAGGFGNVPEFVCSSRENNERLIEYFLNEMPSRGGSILLVEKEDTPLVEDSMILSGKGLYCFDVVIEGEEQGGYTKIAYPDNPVVVSDLPKPIQELLNDHRVAIDTSAADYLKVEHAY